MGSGLTRRGLPSVVREVFNDRTPLAAKVAGRFE
jgi:hypothetical protein